MILLAVVFALATCETLDGKTCIEYGPTWCWTATRCTPAENATHPAEIKQQDECRQIAEKNDGLRTTKRYNENFLACMREHGFKEYE